MPQAIEQVGAADGPGVGERHLRRSGQRRSLGLFALTANRALKPSSKLAATDWVAHDVHIASLSDVGDDACYRAMDTLLDIEKVLTEQIYHQVADLLNLEVDTKLGMCSRVEPILHESHHVR